MTVGMTNGVMIGRENSGFNEPAHAMACRAISLSSRPSPIARWLAGDAFGCSTITLFLNNLGIGRFPPKKSEKHGLVGRFRVVMRETSLQGDRTSW
jgi:hypothetical protein